MALTEEKEDGKTRVVIDEELSIYAASALREGLLASLENEGGVMVDLAGVTVCDAAGIKPIERRIVLNEIKPFPFQDLFFTSIRYDEPVSVFDSNRKLTNRELLDKRPNVLLVCGIANPEPLIDYTKRFSDDVQNLIFPDHYKFKESDLQKIVTKFNVLPENSIILTTEKDAVRLRELSGINKTLKKNFYYIPVGVNFLGGECEKFNERILNYVTKNKRNGFIHHR
jgi:tetraacyldisaccharide 4'-kinase